jgi:hypothetical protein
MTAQCPVCFGELEVRGEGGTLRRGPGYWWCPYCDAPREPAEAESGADEAPAPA